MALPLGNAEYPFTSLYYIFGSFYVSIYVCLFLCILFMASQTAGSIAIKFTEL